LSLDERRSFIDMQHEELSVRAQCDLWGIQRSSAYYVPVEINSETLAIMKLIDQMYIDCPYYGARKFTDQLCKMGWLVNHKRISRLMRLMGIQAIYQRPSLSVSSPENKVYPYLLRNLVVRFPNHVWSTDITYIPMRTGFMYCVAVIDWFSRYVLAWDISNVQDAGFCLQVMNSSFSFGLPEIFNTDQGAQFTSNIFTGRLLELKIRISMDGRGRALDNVFVERLWRSLKYEDIYIHDYEDPRSLRQGMQNYFDRYNFKRPHQALGYATPAEVYFGKVVGVTG
jgi:putative transposase